MTEFKQKRPLYKAILGGFLGVGRALKAERTFKIQIMLASLAVILGFLFDISVFEWLALVLVIGWVLSLELLNTQLENLIDHLHPEVHPTIGRIKDLAASSVLVSALTSLVVAALIFLPKIL